MCLIWLTSDDQNSGIPSVLWTSFLLDPVQPPSSIPMFSNNHVLRYPCSTITVPPKSMFPSSHVPLYLCSPVLKFHCTYVPQFLCSTVPMFPDLYSTVPMFPNYCSPIPTFPNHCTPIPNNYLLVPIFPTTFERSRVPMFPVPVFPMFFVPQYLCSPVHMFPDTYAPQ